MSHFTVQVLRQVSRPTSSPKHRQLHKLWWPSQNTLAIETRHQQLANQNKLKEDDFIYIPGRQNMTARPIPRGGLSGLSARLLVSKSAAGYLIGKAGQKVRELKEESGAQLQFRNAEEELALALSEDERVLEIRGGAQERDQGVRVVKQIPRVNMNYVERVMEMREQIQQEYVQPAPVIEYVQPAPIIMPTTQYVQPAPVITTLAAPSITTLPTTTIGTTSLPVPVGTTYGSPFGTTLGASTLPSYGAALPTYGATLPAYGAPLPTYGATITPTSYLM